MDIKPIYTENDYRATLAEIERLMDAAPGSPEEERLDVLATLAAAYEEQHYPIPHPSPIAAIEYYLESRGLTRKALEPFIGSPNRVSEILNRRRRLTLEMIRRLEAGGSDSALCAGFRGIDCQRVWGQPIQAKRRACIEQCVLPRLMGQQLKEVDQFDGWLGDGSAAWVAAWVAGA